MAKKAKSTQVINIKKKPVDGLEFLKAITKWITNTKRSDSQLEDIIEKYKIENTIIKRILSYNLGFPYIIHYFNKYLNHIFDFNSYNTKTLIKSITYLMDINNRNNPKMFMYIKSNDLKDEIKDTIKKLIKEYLSIAYGIFCNKRELNFYYKLFKLGVIKDEDLLEIDRLLNGDKPVIKSLNFINYKEVLGVEDIVVDEIYTPQKESSPLNNEIIEFINNIKNTKINRDECKKCELYNKPIVVLDTNAKELQKVDIVFIGLNPGKDEVQQDKPFVGDSGKYIRRIIDKLPNDKTWVIFNIILCHTNNKKDINNIHDVIRNCMDFINDLFGSFPSNLYIPIGDDAKSVFGITDSITSISGKKVSLENNKIVIPLIHPSSILRNPKYQSIYDSSVKNILSMFNVVDDLVAARSESVSNTQNIVQDDKDLLLVDIKKIENGKLLMIYTDVDGNKKYITKDYQFPIMIKNKDWKECGMIADKTDDVCILNDYQKSILNKKCRQILEQMVRA